MPLIRLASPDDAGAIAHIDQLCNAWPAEQITEKIRKSLEKADTDWAVFVAEENKQLLAYARCARLEFAARPELPAGWYVPERCERSS